MKFSSFWIFRIEALVKLYSPFAKKIPLKPPFSWFDLPHHDPDPFDKLRVTLSTSKGQFIERVKGGIYLTMTIPPSLKKRGQGRF